MFDPSARSAIEKIAKDMGIEPAALLAVAQVESGGNALMEGLCPIRWEGHYFWRLTSGQTRETAVAAGIADPKAGVVRNPKSMKARHDLLSQARQIDDEAALQSCSWGLGQVMGAHWKALGYESARDLADRAMSGIDGQVELMTRFIKHKGLTNDLNSHNWASFAKVYNGPNYGANQYDTKLAAAYDEFSKKNLVSRILAALTAWWRTLFTAS